MLNTSMKLISLLLFSLILGGCGGAGGSAESTENKESAAGEPLVFAEPVEQAVLEMDSLVAAEDFTFTSKNQIQVLVELSAYQELRSYVSLYREYQQLDSGRYYPDPASRVISGVLQNGIFAQSFTGLNNQQQYLIEVWFYDGREPLQKALSVNENQLLWRE